MLSRALDLVRVWLDEGTEAFLLLQAIGARWSGYFPFEAETHLRLELMHQPTSESARG
jgi:hypothetical protein